MRFYERKVTEKGYTGLCAIGDKKQLTRALPDYLHEPVVFYFSGIRATDDSLYKGERVLDVLGIKTWAIEKALGGKEIYKTPGVKFFALTYSPSRVPKEEEIDREERSILDHLWLTTGFLGKFPSLVRAVREGNPKTYITTNAREFADIFNLPALKDSDGKFLPKERIGVIAEKFRHMTFVGESYGSLFSQHVARYLHKILCREAGYSSREANDLIKNIVNISFANISYNRGKNLMTNVYFEGRGDNLITTVQRAWAEGISAFRNSMFTIGNKGADLPRLLTKAEEDVFRQRQNAPYRSSEEADNMRLSRVNNGLIAHFDVPQKFDTEVQGENGALKCQYIANPFKHNTLSYTLPIAGHRDHADLLARVARNAVGRVNKNSAITPLELLKTRTVSLTNSDPSLESGEKRAINNHLDEMVQKYVTRLNTEGSEITRDYSVKDAMVIARGRRQHRVKKHQQVSVLDPTPAAFTR